MHTYIHAYMQTYYIYKNWYNKCHLMLCHRWARYPPCKTVPAVFFLTEPEITYPNFTKVKHTVVFTWQFHYNISDASIVIECTAEKMATYTVPYLVFRSERRAPELSGWACYRSISSLRGRQSLQQSTGLYTYSIHSHCSITYTSDESILSNTY